MIFFLIEFFIYWLKSPGKWFIIIVINVAAGLSALFSAWRGYNRHNIANHEYFTCRRCWNTTGRSGRRHNAFTLRFSSAPRCCFAPFHFLVVLNRGLPRSSRFPAAATGVRAGRRDGAPERRHRRLFSASPGNNQDALKFAR